MAKKIEVTLNADRTAGTVNGNAFSVSAPRQPGGKPFVFIPGNWVGKRTEVTKYYAAVEAALAA